VGGGLLSFVGLGPGDPGLRTERAVSRIAQADTVTNGSDVRTETLIELVRSGQRVVRVVAGDPLESTHVLAEVRDAARAGVAVEVVPGIGAPAAAGAFAGVLGRAAWVFAGDVAGWLFQEPADRTVTLVAQPGLPGQRVVVTTAGQASASARALGEGPLVLVINAPDPDLRWFERQPLFGKRVLVTRARAQSEAAATLLRERGAEPVVVPTIEIRPPSDPEPLARSLQKLRSGLYAWVAFTSANGVERTWAALVAAGADARAFGGVRLAAIGPATAQALDAHGLRPDVVAHEFRGERLADEMLAAVHAGPPFPRVLLARAARARDVLPAALRAAGWIVDVVAAYETHLPSRETAGVLAREFDRARIDAVTLTSSSTVDNLCDLLGPMAAQFLGRSLVASIGPVTTATALARGVRVDVTATQYTVRGLVDALAESFDGRSAPSDR
jgi:uroporphyrinogen III methyltransferase/synthase